MIIEKMFAKDIRRPIEGVIKADDESQLETELKEYVLTNEAADRFFKQAIDNSGADAYTGRMK